MSWTLESAANDLERYVLSGEPPSMEWVSRPYRGIYRIGRKAHVCCECRDSFRKWFYEAKLQQGWKAVGND